MRRKSPAEVAAWEREHAWLIEQERYLRRRARRRWLLILACAAAAALASWIGWGPAR